MSSILSELGGITAGVGAEGLAFAAGFAAAHALEPEAVTILQDAWHAAQVRRIDPGTASEIAAEDIATYADMQSEATYSGWDESRFAHLYNVKLVAPGMGELLQMIRRGTIDGDGFTHGLRKGKLETRWDGPLRELQNVYLDPAILAVMLQRNVIPNQGQLPGVTLDTTGRVPRFPHVDIDAYGMAAKFGWDGAQLDAQTRIQGLPPGMDLIARGVFRDILDRGDFNLGAEQSNRRVEWADFEFETYRQILTADQYTERQLRGFTDRAGRLADTKKHGMSQADSDKLYDVLGRAPSIRQVFIGLARGATYDGNPTTIPEPYLSAAQRSNMRPEWYSIAYENRYSLPSAFVVRTLLTDGAIDTARGQSIFEHSGWPSDLAQLVAEHYGKSAATPSDPHVTKAQTSLYTTAHRSYLAAETDAAAIEPAFTKLGISQAAQTEVLALWDVERELIRKQLTPAQIKKAVSEGVTNPATGAAWSQDDALAALIARGYAPNDAATFLAI